MNLRDCRFYYAGNDMKFAVFSNYPCRARYLENISLPLAPPGVTAYEVEPGADTQWVVVTQIHGDEERVRFFVRSGKEFIEKTRSRMPGRLRAEIKRRFPVLSAGFKNRQAA